MKRNVLPPTAYVTPCVRIRCHAFLAKAAPTRPAIQRTTPTYMNVFLCHGYLFMTGSIIREEKYMRPVHVDPTRVRVDGATCENSCVV